MPEFNWDQSLKGIDFSLPEGQNAPDIEKIKAPDTGKMAGKTVFVQKIITEVWLYTDVEGKAFGHQGIQDIVVIGEMPYDEALKMIADRKNKKRRRG